MNGDSSQKNHVRWITTCITILGVCAIGGGSVLIYKGYNGDLLIGGGLAAISGLAGFLGAGRPNQSQPDITVNSTPAKTTVQSVSSSPPAQSVVDVHATPTPEPTPPT